MPGLLDIPGMWGPVQGVQQGAQQGLLAQNPLADPYGVQQSQSAGMGQMGLGPNPGQIGGPNSLSGVTPNSVAGMAGRMGSVVGNMLGGQIGGLVGGALGTAGQVANTNAALESLGLSGGRVGFGQTLGASLNGTTFGGMLGLGNPISGYVSGNLASSYGLNPEMAGLLSGLVAQTMDIAPELLGQADHSGFGVSSGFATGPGLNSAGIGTGPNGEPEGGDDE